MQIINWQELDETRRRELMQRPALAESFTRENTVADIIRSVRERGDASLRELTARFDGVDIKAFRASQDDIAAAGHKLAPEVRDAIDQAFETIRRFHQPSGRAEYAVETAPGVQCRRVVRPLRSVGLYVPGGTAPLPSTVLMLGVPSQLAGCETRVLCTPPNAGGSVDPAILYAAQRCGIETVLRVGGAQAVAALAYGTKSVPRVDKIFGPGNSWVSEAKRQVAQDPDGAVCDMPAGPSEVLVIADTNANPEFVAADLLSQAEHGPDSQVVLLSPSMTLVSNVRDAINRQLALLPRVAIARQALAAGRLIVVADLDVALDISNQYAPEHLILNVDAAESLLPRVANAGSVFLGAWTPESLGDYISGTNHVLPTYGYARQMGGLSVADFQKSFSVQTATSAGLEQLGPSAIALARAEGLEAHARAVGLRLQSLEVRRERA